MKIKKNSLIYVAGHTGLIGSAIVRNLKYNGYSNVLTRTRGELDLKDYKRTEAFFSRNRPEYVFLAAARTGSIQANNTYPAEFIFDNLMIQANIIDLAYRYAVRKLLLLVSSCVYPKFCRQPMKEKYILTGCIEPTNEPFAIAKLAGIKMCQAYNKQYGTNFISVIPANIYGINDHFDERAHVLSSLIKKFSEAKIKGYKRVIVWGTGKPKREFLYVDDLASACLFLMKQYNSSEPINIGTGVETSIRKLAGLIKEITGFKGEIKYDTTKPDGNPRRLLESSKISSLGWEPKVNLEEGIRMTYNWIKAKKGI